MSHHLDTPLAGQRGQLFIDDLYVFPGTDATVFVMDVNSDVTGERAEPGFHPEARYEFRVHTDGADFESLTYRLSFGQPDSAGRQALWLTALTGDQAHADAADGELVLEGATGAEASGGGARVWAGRASDSFYIDLSLLGIVNDAVKNGTAVDLSGWHPENAYIGGQVAAVVSATGTSDDPRDYGQAVADELFPDVLPYVVGTPAAYGFAGINGRTLADNAPEAMLSLVTNMAVPSGLRPAVAQQQRTSDFPYVVPA